MALRATRFEVRTVKRWA